MHPFRNGSLPANALLIAIGAAAGVGVTVLVSPFTAERRENAADASPSRSQAFNRKSNSSAPAAKAPATILNAVQMTDPQERADSLREAGADAAREDPAAALLAAAEIGSEQDKLEFLRGIYSVWGATDPVAALEYAKNSMPAGLARSEVIGIAVNKWAGRNPREAWLWSEGNLSGPLQEQAMIDVLISWTRKTPEAASQWFASTGYNSQALIGAVARTYAEQKPKEALAWATGLADPQARRNAIDPIVPVWIEQNPAEAIAGITPLLSTPEGADLPVLIANIWGTTDPGAASEWINKLPAGSGKNEAAATLATVWAASDIQGAIAWSASLGDENMRRQVVTHIGTTWGAIDPDNALEWLATLPGPIAAEGVAGAFGSWAATDPVGLQEAVDGTPSSPEMDQARLALADVLSATDNAAAMNLASQLSSAAGRDNAAARYFRQWRKTDDTSAQDWLTQNWSSLPPSTQQRLTIEQRRAIVAR